MLLRPPFHFGQDRAWNMLECIYACKYEKRLYRTGGRTSRFYFFSWDTQILKLKCTYDKGGGFVSSPPPMCVCITLTTA